MVLQNKPDYLQIGAFHATATIFSGRVNDLEGPDRYLRLEHRQHIPEPFKPLYGQMADLWSGAYGELMRTLPANRISDGSPGPVKVAFDQTDLIANPSLASATTSAYLSLRFLDTIIMILNPGLKKPGDGWNRVNPGIRDQQRDEELAQRFREMIGPSLDPVKVELRMQEGSIDFEHTPLLLKIPAFAYLAVAFTAVSVYPSFRDGATELFHDLNNARKALSRSLPVENVVYERDPRPLEDIISDFLLYRDDDLLTEPELTHLTEAIKDDSGE